MIAPSRDITQYYPSRYFTADGFGKKGANLTFDKLRNLEPCGLDCLTGRPLGAIVNPPQNLHTIGVPLGGRHRAGGVVQNSGCVSGRLCFRLWHRIRRSRAYVVSAADIASETVIGRFHQGVGWGLELRQKPIIRAVFMRVPVAISPRSTPNRFIGCHTLITADGNLITLPPYGPYVRNARNV
jgi:hypothetical protein